MDLIDDTFQDTFKYQLNYHNSDLYYFRLNKMKNLRYSVTILELASYIKGTCIFHTSNAQPYQKILLYGCIQRKSSKERSIMVKMGKKNIVETRQTCSFAGQGCSFSFHPASILDDCFRVPDNG